MYQKGNGVPQDTEKQLLGTSSPLQGLDLAQFYLGQIYYSGETVPQNYKLAAELWTLAAGQGFVEAQYNLGVMHKSGQGVERDLKEAEVVMDPRG